MQARRDTCARGDGDADQVIWRSAVGRNTVQVLLLVLGDLAHSAADELAFLGPAGPLALTGVPDDQWHRSRSSARLWRGLARNYT